MAKKPKKKLKKPLPKAGKKEGEAEKVSTLKRTKIRVVGIGGGGGNIVSELAQKVGRATFVAANTDLQALKQVSRKVERFPFGQSLTRGLGTGMNPGLAEAAAQNEKERIKKIFQGQDLVILIACLGGGTGSGAAALFAKASQGLGNLTYGIFTLPFQFEGEKKKVIAKGALESLRTKLNTFTVLPNERIFQIIEKTTPLKEAFSSINKNLTAALEGLIETIYHPGLINIDFADLRTILEGRGRLAYLNTFSLPKVAETKSHLPSRSASPSATKEGTAREAVERAMTSPLYPYGIKGAKGVLFNIAGEKDLSLEEVNQISKTILEKANPEAKIIFGIQPLLSGGNKNIIKTTIFATGCTNFKEKPAGSSKKSKRRKTKRPKKKPAVKRKRRKRRSLSRFPSAETKPVPKLLPEVKKIEKTKKSKPKKRKVKIKKKPEKKPEPASAAEAEETKKEKPNASGVKVPVKVRKNALQVKKETEEAEKEILEKEKFWETPAFLRQKKTI